MVMTLARTKEKSNIGEERKKILRVFSNVFLHQNHKSHFVKQPILILKGKVGFTSQIRPTQNLPCSTAWRTGCTVPGRAHSVLHRPVHAVPPGACARTIFIRIALIGTKSFKWTLGNTEYVGTAWTLNIGKWGIRPSAGQLTQVGWLD